MASNTSFDENLSLFELNLKILINEISEELENSITENITAKMRLGKITDPIVPRYVLYKTHAKKIGENLLTAFDSDINPFSSRISEESEETLKQLFDKQFENVISHLERSLPRLAGSLGWTDRPESYVSPARGIYQSAQKKYWNHFVLRIKRHNREIKAREQEPSERLMVSLKKATGAVRSMCNQKNWEGSDRIDVCRYYLEKHRIEGKPNYTAEQLNNLISQQINKETNRRPAQR